MKCDGLGMPLLTNNGTIYGNLLINFDIVFTMLFNGHMLLVKLCNDVIVN